MFKGPEGQSRVQINNLRNRCGSIQARANYFAHSHPLSRWSVGQSVGQSHSMAAALVDLDGCADSCSRNADWYIDLQLERFRLERVKFDLASLGMWIYLPVKRKLVDIESGPVTGPVKRKVIHLEPGPVTGPVKRKVIDLEPGPVKVIDLEPAKRRHIINLEPVVLE